MNLEKLVEYFGKFAGSPCEGTGNTDTGHCRYFGKHYLTGSVNEVDSGKTRLGHRMTLVFAEADSGKSRSGRHRAVSAAGCHCGKYPGKPHENYSRMGL